MPIWLVGLAARLGAGAVLGWALQAAADSLGAGWSPCPVGAEACSAAWGPFSGAVLGMLSALGKKPRALPPRLANEAPTPAEEPPLEPAGPSVLQGGPPDEPGI